MDQFQQLRTLILSAWRDASFASEIRDKLQQIRDELVSLQSAPNAARRDQVAKGEKQTFLGL
jgi:hypothetical protein